MGLFQIKILCWSQIFMFVNVSCSRICSELYPQHSCSWCLMKRYKNTCSYKWPFQRRLRLKFHCHHNWLRCGLYNLKYELYVMKFGLYHEVCPHWTKLPKSKLFALASQYAVPGYCQPSINIFCWIQIAFFFSLVCFDTGVHVGTHWKLATSSSAKWMYFHIQIWEDIT